MSVLEKNNPKTIKAWTFYDWANSVFPLVITSAIFPNFYDAVTSTKDDAGNVISNTVQCFGGSFENQNIYSFVYAFALFLVVLSAPILSGIADYMGNKKRFLQFFCYLGSISCMCLFFFDAKHLELSFIPFIFATVGYWGSLVYYNSYLPDIATEDKQDAVSAKGFSLGYLGSSLLLIVCLALVMSKAIYHLMGDDVNLKGIDVKVSFLLVGLWWMGFAQYTFKNLPNLLPTNKDKSDKGNFFTKGFHELQEVFKQSIKIVALKRFLYSYFFYNMGVQTVMVVAVLFARNEVIWQDEQTKTTSLIVSILIIQFVGIAGSYIFSMFSKKIGNINSLLIAIAIWIFICLFTFWVVRLPFHFYIVAFMVGFVMGGIQALSRSTYSKLLPSTTDTASFFSFYDVMEKLGMIIGTVSFGLISEATGGMRNAVLALTAFFILGFLLLLRVPQKKVEIVEK
jgi:MFS transporter, UMF1 family